jgi:hypothetical protein
MSIKKARSILARIDKAEIEEKLKKDIVEYIDGNKDSEQWSVMTDSGYPEWLIECLTSHARSLLPVVDSFSEFPELGCVVGEGDWDSVERVWDVAKLRVWNVIESDEDAADLDKCLWDEEPPLAEECRLCLKKENVKTDCDQYVRFVVGECKGKRDENVSAEEVLNRLLKEAKNVPKSKLQRNHL